ncbi:MAG: 50S ribosomal protein L22 [Actinomycetota bacterium]
MEARARAKYIRIAPRKSRLVVDMIRGKNAAESAVILQFSTREASKAILKVLNSAVANAVQKGASGADNLVVSEAFVDEGPILKRWRPRAQGRASRINKRTSHITLVLNEIEKTEVKKTKEPAPAKSAAKKAAKKGEVASSPKKKAAPRNDGKTTKKEPKAKITETKAKKAVSKEDSSGSEG